MAGIRNKKLKGGQFQGWYYNYTGKRIFFKGTSSKSETRKMAQALEDKHRPIREGCVEAPKSASKHRTRPFSEVVDEYVAWGNSQGGRGGRSWGKVHARSRQSHLRWWEKRLGMETLADLDGILGRVEEALRELQSAGRTGKTCQHYSEAMAAFCHWCVNRGYLQDNPLKALAGFDTTPTLKRRAATADEIRKLLNSCAPHRRLLYEVAFTSGLRAGELRSLTVDHLDVENNGLLLDAEWTKNRKSGFQPLPADVVACLHKLADSDEVEKRYSKLYQRKDSNKPVPKKPVPKKPLLYVPTHTARDLEKDLKTAGIPKWAPGGKLDFHAFRVAYITFVLESGATVKEAQALARHATPELTMNLYGRTRQERLSEVVESVGKVTKPDPECAHSVFRKAVGSVEINTNPLQNKKIEVVEAAGIEPASREGPRRASTLIVLCLIYRFPRGSKGQDT